MSATPEHVSTLTPAAIIRCTDWLGRRVQIQGTDAGPRERNETMTTENPEAPKQDGAAAVARTDLLACPFCGGPARLYAWLFFGWYCQCGSCGAKAGRIQNTEAEAIEIWNRRFMANNQLTDGGPSLDRK